MLSRKVQIDEMTNFLRGILIGKQNPEGVWRGELSSSAISTSVSVFALFMIDKEGYGRHIQAGAQWLASTMKPDGSWGDTVESKSNMTATLLTYAVLFSLDIVPQATKTYLNTQFGGLSDEQIIEGVMKYYGTDLTFSVPILAMCALAGVITHWKPIPRFPFELSILPQRFFRFLRLPVVSYAIPALIAVGILRHRKEKKGLLYSLREAFVKKSLQVLEKLQPANGGFLEAAPLTGFVAMCMSGAGYKDHVVTQKAAGFLTATVRRNGAWPIDTDLACWVTALSVKAMGENLPKKEALLEAVRQSAFTYTHPFTGAKAGGWGWTNLPGAAPDADDTAGNLIALHILQEGKYCHEAEMGIKWLLDLQNNDGGIPTFCKGWGKLPFDRSSPDISAHSLMALELWYKVMPQKLQQKCSRSMHRLLQWMKKTQTDEGAWIPLWFGDQDAPGEQAPVYGTAVTVEHLSISAHPVAADISAKGIRYLLSAQNDDGGWGGAKGLPSKVTFTARVLSALTTAHPISVETVTRGTDYLYSRFRAGTLIDAEPVGLYFARLWYSEDLYNITFALNALEQIRKRIICEETN
ncbi:MAG: squalene--hopene cyclase [Mediterranea sp.]|jgi:squalene-hopene/tetraprenyl-beta-curcumene cyclase|nr:squalene--hopene cyclase [Mediterranea sp.]